MVRKPGTGIFERWTTVGTNKTGGATVAGGVYALDVTRTDATSVDGETALTNVVACATANLRCILVVALGAYAVGASGEFLIRGVANVLVDGTTAVGVGDKLIPQNASPNLIKQANPSLVNPVGMANAAQATAAGTLTQVLFDGEAWKGERAAS